MNVLHLLFIAVFTSENRSGSSIQSVRAVAFSFLHSLNENIVVFFASVRQPAYKDYDRSANSYSDRSGIVSQ